MDDASTVAATTLPQEVRDNQQEVGCLSWAYVSTEKSKMFRRKYVAVNALINWVDTSH